VSILIALIYLLTIPSENEIRNECACQFEIYYGELGTAEPPCELPSTQKIYNDNLQTEITIRSCEGDAVFKSYNKVNGDLKFSGNFKQAEFIDRIDTTYILNEIDYSETFEIRHMKYWLPEKIGSWNYY
jgi:hypothetical protein